jgi:hypothetical protein
MSYDRSGIPEFEMDGFVLKFVCIFATISTEEDLTCRAEYVHRYQAVRLQVRYIFTEEL